MEETIHVEDETLRRGFTAIPTYIIRHKHISPGAKLVYIVLLTYAWQEGSCFPGQQRMAEDIGVTDRSVRTYLKELVDAKFISIKRRGLNQTNVYTIHRFSPEAETVSDQERKQRSTQQRKRVPTTKTQSTKGDKNYKNELVADGENFAGWIHPEEQ